ncbi:MAG: 3-methylmercaptopropionyl-CoA ligase of DmdB2 type [uncultured Sphingomonadaceae bacterium]|uniref:3-methylmercaptopropionyl-CoA ligase n=1 Tax=uncultured Sphingomonadaceae bacterium TaxID=169976 RepID=A0A6J4U4L8_9SPHN|nr:MAG: 3-methylmercaptopropionyl-CoA ligase of DmdB2 type [uncultured Sphingomonadaceae bacterium]
MIGGMQDWPLRIPRLIDHAAREHGGREIVSRWADGTTTRTNWAGVARDARRLANALTRMGIGRGDRVATLAMNHSRHLATWYGVIGMGGVVHTINPRLFDDQLAYIANHAEDRVLFYDAAFAPIVERMKPRWTSIERYVCFDPAEAGAGFEELIANEDDDFIWVEGDEREPALLCYTSGTTGNPKGVLYEHRSTVLHAMAEIAPDVFDLSARTVALPIVPMFHVAAWGLPFSTAMVGCKLVFSADYRPDVLCELLAAERVTHSAGVPTVWASLIAHVEATGAGLGPLRLVTIGGSAAPRAMIEWFTERGIRVMHAWGMTETSPIGTSGAPPAHWDEMNADERLDYAVTQGRVPFGVELRVAGPDGATLPRDGVSAGALQIKGPWVIDRYFGDETGPAVGADKWFDTGDVAVIRPDGVMRITDRAKDVIKSGGEWISSIELENAAVGCAGVAEAAAVGVSHPKWDERPLLLVVRRPGAEVSADAIIEHLGRHVAKWWLPDEIIFVDALPHTATGKLLKTALRERYKDHRLPTA